MTDINDRSQVDTEPVTPDTSVSKAISARRKLLASLPAAIAAATLPALAFGRAGEMDIQQCSEDTLRRVAAARFPDVTVTDHQGQQHRFFADLIQDRVVMINFMSIEAEADYPVTAQVARLVHSFADKIGKELHVFSISYDSTNDTPERLAEFARQFDAPEGWRFLTADADSVVALGLKLYRAEGRPHRKLDADLIHYGNAASGLWATVGSMYQDLDLSRRRIASVMPREVPPSPQLRQAGPRRLNTHGAIYDNAEPGRV
ncbi:MAG: hypothetical protein KKC01_02355 [Gammaproteobacteria bacterium]|nr:hypothetical protein [Gammaproteobacteria bacterium]